MTMAGLTHNMPCCFRLLLLCAVFCWQRTSAQANYPTAKNITWESTNFKTLLKWSGEPTNFQYTVEIRNQFIGSWEKKCAFTTNTECDVTSLLKDVNATYDARVVSEVRIVDDVEEFPYAEGPSFKPYDQTIIGKPTFESFGFNEDLTQLKVVVKDPITPYRFNNNTMKTVRDIFGNDFQYTLFYRKASSTGRKEARSATNEIVISTSKGEGYCFFVRATIQSRKENRYSQDSDEKCASSEGNAARGFSASTVFLYLCNLILLFWLL